MPNLTSLFLDSSEGTYVAFTRELTSQSTTNWNWTETTSTLINSVWGDLQSSPPGESLVDSEKGIRFPSGWFLMTDPLSLVVAGDIVTVIGSSAIFEIQGVERWNLDGEQWEFSLEIRR